MPCHSLARFQSIDVSHFCSFLMSLFYTRSLLYSLCYLPLSISLSLSLFIRLSLSLDFLSVSSLIFLYVTLLRSVAFNISPSLPLSLLVSFSPFHQVAVSFPCFISLSLSLSLSFTLFLSFSLSLSLPLALLIASSLFLSLFLDAIDLSLDDALSQV